jgi:hypothetical protein
MKTQLSQLPNSEGRKIQMDVNSVYIDYYSFLSFALNLSFIMAPSPSFYF